VLAVAPHQLVTTAQPLAELLVENTYQEAGKRKKVANPALFALAFVLVLMGCLVVSLYSFYEEVQRQKAELDDQRLRCVASLLLLGDISTH
jgi:ABC-type phosphate transport system permease subunit